MRTTKYALLLLGALTTLAGLANPAAQFAAGKGTPDQPYLIDTCGQLQNINTDLSASYRLNQDINCVAFSSSSTEYFVPIGSAISPFTGQFDGAGHVVSYLTIRKRTTDNVGLFGVVDNPKTVIKNVTITYQNITGQNNVGGIVGLLKAGTLSGDGVGMQNCPDVRMAPTCYLVSGTLEANDGIAGGLVGSNLAGTITNSFVNQTVIGTTSVGGLVGVNGGSITNSYTIGYVSASNGTDDSTFVGGLVGTNTSTGSINQSFASTKLASTMARGGLVAVNNGGSIKDSFWDTDVSRTTVSAGGTGETTQALHQKSTYVNWNFTQTWDIDNDKFYPYLRMHQAPMTMHFFFQDSPSGGLPDQVTIVASKADYNGLVYLSSTMGPVRPQYIYMVNGIWTGKVLPSYTPTQFIARWDPAITPGVNVSYSKSLQSENVSHGDLQFNLNTLGIPADQLSYVLTLDDLNPALGLLDPDRYNLAKGKVPASGVISLSDIKAGFYYLWLYDKNNNAAYPTLSPVRIFHYHYSNNGQVTVTAKSICANNTLTPVILMPDIGGSTRMLSNPTLPATLPFATTSWFNHSLTLYDPLQAHGWTQLEQDLISVGYTKGCTLFTAPYDWTLPVTDIRDQYLTPVIDEALSRSHMPKVDIIAAGLGGIVARSYIQDPNEPQNIRRFAMVGTPNHGAAVDYGNWEGGQPSEYPNSLLTPITLNLLYHQRSIPQVMPCSSVRYSAVYDCVGTATYPFIHHQFLSLRALLPTYDNALYHVDTDTYSGLTASPNQLLLALNDQACPQQEKCLDPWGEAYHFLPPSAVTARTEAAKIFGSNAVPTLTTLNVGQPGATYYPDGTPKRVASDDGTYTPGDGDVPLSSLGLNAIPMTINHRAGHLQLIKYFAKQLTMFVSNKEPTAKPLNESKQSALIFYLVGPGRFDLYPKPRRPGTPIPAPIRLDNLNAASAVYLNPVDGQYPIYIKPVTISGQVTLYVIYINPNTNTEIVRSLQTITRGGKSAYFDFTLTSITGNPMMKRLTFTRSTARVEDLQMEQSPAGFVRLHWKLPPDIPAETQPSFRTILLRNDLPGPGFVCTSVENKANTCDTKYPWDTRRNYVIQGYLPVDGAGGVILSKPLFVGPYSVVN